MCLSAETCDTNDVDECYRLFLLKELTADYYLRSNYYNEIREESMRKVRAPNPSCLHRRCHGACTRDRVGRAQVQQAGARSSE